MTTTADLERRIHHALDTITTAWNRHTSPLRSPRPTIGTTHRPPNETSPIPPGILDARLDTAQTLYGWCRILIEDRGLNHAAVHLADVPGMTRLLNRHATWLTGHEAAHDLTDELETTAHRLDNATTPHTQRTWRIGDCPGTEQQPCGGEVRARPDKGTARCRNCGATRTIDEWRDLLPPAPLVTVRGLVDALLIDGHPTTEKAIHRHIEKGHLTVVGTDHRGRRLLNRAEAAAAILERRRTA